MSIYWIDRAATAGVDETMELLEGIMIDIDTLPQPLYEIAYEEIPEE